MIWVYRKIKWWLKLRRFHIRMEKRMNDCMDRCEELFERYPKDYFLRRDVYREILRFEWQSRKARKWMVRSDPGFFGLQSEV